MTGVPHRGSGTVVPASTHRVRLTTGDDGWLVRLGPSGATVQSGTDADRADATVAAAPRELLLWLWRRVGDETVQRRGDAASADRLRRALEVATQ